MAKQKIDLPSIEQSAPSELPQTAYVSYPVEPDEVINNQLPQSAFEEHREFARAIQEEVLQSMNIPESQFGHMTKKVDVKMNLAQARRFKVIARKLEDENKRLKDGTPVTNKRRAMLWLIENF